MLRGGLLYLLIRGGTGLLVIAAIPIFTRLMPPSEYGLYALGMSCALIGSSVLYQWLAVSFGRFYPVYADRPGVMAGAAMRGFWITTAVVVAAAVLLAPLVGKFGGHLLLYAGVVAIAIGLGRYNLSLQAASSTRALPAYAALSWTRSGVALLLGVVLIGFAQSAESAMASNLIGIAVALLLCNPLRAVKADTPPPGVGAAFFRYGLPLTLNSVAIVVVDLADRLLIAGLLGSVAVGPYAVGYDLVQQSLGAPLNVLLLAAFPSIVAAYENESPAAARERQHRLGAAVLAVGVPAALGLSALAGDIARLMFGYNFRADATAMMPWLACGVFFGAIKSYYFDLSFQLTHQTRMQSFIALGMAALNIALNLVLLPRIGVLGAAIATCAAFAAGLLASATIGRRVLPLPSLLGVLPGVGAATLGMYAVLRALSPHHGILWLGVKVVAGGLAYLLLAVLFNVGQSRSTLMRAWSELNLNPVDR